MYNNNALIFIELKEEKLVKHLKYSGVMYSTGLSTYVMEFKNIKKFLEYLIKNDDNKLDTKLWIMQLIMLQLKYVDKHPNGNGFEDDFNVLKNRFSKLSSEKLGNNYIDLNQTININNSYEEHFLFIKKQIENVLNKLGIDARSSIRTREEQINSLHRSLINLNSNDNDQTEIEGEERVNELIEEARALRAYAESLLPLCTPGFSDAMGGKSEKVDVSNNVTKQTTSSKEEFEDEEQGIPTPNNVDFNFFKEIFDQLNSQPQDEYQPKEDEKPYHLFWIELFSKIDVKQFSQIPYKDYLQGNLNEFFCQFISTFSSIKELSKLDYEKIKQKILQLSEKDVKSNLEKLFEILKDPIGHFLIETAHIIEKTGQTYDRESILQKNYEGKLELKVNKCPLTKELLSKFDKAPTNMVINELLQDLRNSLAKSFTLSIKNGNIQLLNNCIDIAELGLSIQELHLMSGIDQTNILKDAISFKDKSLASNLVTDKHFNFNHKDNYDINLFVQLIIVTNDSLILTDLFKLSGLKLTLNDYIMLLIWSVKSNDSSLKKTCIEWLNLNHPKILNANNYVVLIQIALENSHYQLAVELMNQNDISEKYSKLCSIVAITKGGTGQILINVFKYFPLNSETSSLDVKTSLLYFLSLAKDADSILTFINDLKTSVSWLQNSKFSTAYAVVLQAAKLRLAVLGHADFTLLSDLRSKNTDKSNFIDANRKYWFIPFWRDPARQIIDIDDASLRKGQLDKEIEIFDIQNESSFSTLNLNKC